MKDGAAPIDGLDGLTDAEAARRAAAGQRNAFVSAGPRSAWDIIRDNVFTVFNVVLAVTLLLTVIASLATGQSRGPVLGDLLFSGGTVWLNVMVGIVQELRAKRMLDRLAALSARKAMVRRSGVARVIPADDIVAGDVIVLEPGDRVPVDGPVLRSDRLEVDESLLTGESDSVHKDRDDELMSGSFCVAGAGLMRADRVGAESYANRLTATAKSQKDPLTPLQRKINFVVQLLVTIMVVIAVLNLVAAHNMRVDVVDALRFTLVIVTSFVPAGLILSITVSLSVGAVKIARYDAIVQRVNAVESMGNVTVLCTDKTGTLTENRLSVQAVLPFEGVDEAAAREWLAQYASGASAKNNTALAIARHVGAPSRALAVADEVPFSSARKYGSLTLGGWAEGPAPATGSRITVVLGSPEILFGPAHPSAERVQAGVEPHARAGLRVVALGLSAESAGLDRVPNAEPLALVVIRDEIRTDVRDTMRQFAAAGVRVKVISGDNAETVRAIAGRSGIANESVVTERELSAKSGGEFDALVRSAQLFARIVPETKRRIIESLARQGEYVAMVGDGVNDVPALKAARLAIAMNDGAQIAKDVSELVLLKNTMATLPRALSEGQSITQKIFASATLYLSKNFAVILAILLAGFVGLPFPGTPRLVSWAANLTSAIPAALIAFELIRPSYTHRFGTGVLGYSVIAGAIAGVVSVAAYIMGDFTSSSLAEKRTVFALANLHMAIHIYWDVADVSIFSASSIRRAPREFAAGLGLLAVGLSVPVLWPELLTSAPIGLPEWAIVLGLPLVGAWLLKTVIYGGFTRRLLRTLQD